MSTILYKFRSATTFTPLSLPGTAARLLDIKRAIVRDKKLDSAASAPSSLEFDLQISNAATEEVYDEDAIVPRGTRVVVRRVAVERGRGILNRLAGNDVGVNAAAVDKSDFYTFHQGNGDEDEFVDNNVQPEQDESKELEALMAVTDQAGEMMGQGRAWSGGGGAPMANRPAGAPHFPKPPPKQMTYRPDADPELRAAQPKTKKRATGIPRTFLSEAPKGDGEGLDEEAGGDLASTLVTNKHAFQTLVARSGGQSTNDTTNNLSYALKLTSTTLPEHLQCGICKNLVVNAMLVPWDDLGRPACENCIRDGLLQNGYKCPMTGIEGVSPEDLHPNVGLRKAAEAFEKGVWEKMAEMERQIEEERIIEEKKEAEKTKDEEFEDIGDGIVKNRVKKEKKRKVDNDFGEDEFGGDVFDVADEPEEDEEEEPDIVPVKQETQNDKPSTESKDNNNKLDTMDEPNAEDGNSGEKDIKQEGDATTADASNSSTAIDKEPEQAPRKREAPKRRGPPAGYLLGPAGGGAAMMPVMFGVNVPPPPPPPPKPTNTSASENKSDTASKDGSRTGSVDLNSTAPSQGNGGRADGAHSPQMTGRGRGDGRFSGRFNDYARGGGRFQGRGRYNDGYQAGRGYRGGGGRDFQGGYQGGRGPPNQNWGHNEDWNRKRAREDMEGRPDQQGRGAGRGFNPHYQDGRFDGRGRFQDGGGRGRFEGRGWRGGGRGYGRGRY